MLSALFLMSWSFGSSKRANQPVVDDDPANNELSYRRRRRFNDDTDPGNDDQCPHGVTVPEPLNGEGSGLFSSINLACQRTAVLRIALTNVPTSFPAKATLLMNDARDAVRA